MARILLVDDDAAFRATATRLLERMGHDVRAAAGGREAYAALRTAPVDLVLLDVYMPDEDGIEVIRHLSVEFPGTRVIVASGGGALPSEITLSLAERLGALATLAKPFTTSQLEQAIGRVLTSGSASADAISTDDQAEDP